jgi:carboxyl-terminal processing protease
VLEKIEKQYYGEVDQKELEKAAIAAIMAKLDDDAAVLTPEQMKDFARQMDDQLAGVGIAIHIDKETKQPAVTRVILRSPAQAAGIRAKDLIVSIEGLGTKDATLKDIVAKPRGKRGTPVVLGITRGEEKLEIKVIREQFSPTRIEPWSATPDGKESYWVDKTIGYVHIPAFTKQTASQFRGVVSQLQKDGAKSLVLDLRHCPGGLLTAATEIADLFIDEGIIVSSRGRARSENTNFRAKPETMFADLKVVVLVNKYTASAAEIVAACLQDHHRAAIVGEQTFGRGTVQSLLPLSGGGGLKLTTAAWMRPNGRTLHRREGRTDWGVRPDPGLTVEVTDEERKAVVVTRRSRLNGEDGSVEDDAQLQKALALLHLE